MWNTSAEVGLKKACVPLTLAPSIPKVKQMILI